MPAQRSSKSGSALLGRALWFSRKPAKHLSTKGALSCRAGGVVFKTNLAGGACASLERRLACQHRCRAGAVRLWPGAAGLCLAGAGPPSHLGFTGPLLLRTWLLLLGGGRSHRQQPIFLPCPLAPAGTFDPHPRAVDSRRGPPSNPALEPPLPPPRFPRLRQRFCATLGGCVSPALEKPSSPCRKTPRARFSCASRRAWCRFGALSRPGIALCWSSAVFAGAGPFAVRLSHVPAERPARVAPGLEQLRCGAGGGLLPAKCGSSGWLEGPGNIATRHCARSAVGRFPGEVQ